MIRTGHVIIRLNEARKKKLFERDVKADDGTFYKIFTDIRAEEGTDEHLEQSVMVAEVVNFASDIKWLKIGDLVVIDYLVDMLTEQVLEIDGLDKILLLPVPTTYHTEDRIAYASANSRQDTYTWKKGDINENSLIYAVYRKGKLIPNPPYVICEHKEFTVEKVAASGFIYNDEEEGIVVRKVIASNSSSRYKAGDFVGIERWNLYSRSVEEVNFDIIMEEDVMFLIK